jgi:allantoicase
MGVSDFTQLVDLASERVGGKVLAANDDFFAPKENLIKPAKPIFIEHKYTDRGKWMDGWESRRRRTPGFDWCILRLGLPGILRGVVVDTSFFRGNYPEHCSIEACAVDGAASVKQLTSAATRWVEVLPKSPLQGDSQNRFTIESPYRFTHLRLNIFPDGGVARLRVHGEVLPAWSRILAKGGEIDLVAVQHGGRVCDASDVFFSAPQNLLMPGRGVNMGDGWETKRRRGPGHDWVVLKLGIEGKIHRAVVDTAHFKGNYPESCSLWAGRALDGRDDPGSLTHFEILPRTKLRANAVHEFGKNTLLQATATHAWFNIYPDGGVSRLRIFGIPTPEGRARAGLVRLNALLPEEAEAALRSCCGAARWAQQMAARRPFASSEQLYEAADKLWRDLKRDDWLEAFRSHTKIGGKKAAKKQSGTAARWSKQEQSAAKKAPAKTFAALAKANRAYEARFGYIFIVCATGKTAGEMLAALKQRMNNKPDAELRIAAEEQRKITRLRLEKLLNP